MLRLALIPGIASELLERGIRTVLIYKSLASCRLVENTGVDKAYIQRSEYNRNIQSFPDTVLRINTQGSKNLSPDPRPLPGFVAPFVNM